MSFALKSRLKFVGPALCGASLVAGLGIAFADAPAAPTLSSIVAVAELDLALKNYLEKLKEMTADEESFGKAKDQLGKKANAVVALLQTVGNHDGASPYQAGAVEGMTAARDLGRSKDYATAKKSYDALVAATTKTGAAEAKPKWEKFASLGRMMHETSEVNSRLRRNAKRFGKTKEDSAEAAAILTAFAQATIYDTHEVKNPADLPKWYEMAVEMRDATTDLSKAVRADDEASFKKGIDRQAKAATLATKYFTRNNRNPLHAATLDNGTTESTLMDKRDKKRSEVLKQKLTKAQQLLAAAKKQMDDPEEVRSLEKQIAEATAELAKLKE